MHDRKIYLVPYAHLDTQWRWDYITTISYYLKNTLRKNFHLFDKYPGYCFNFTGAIRYRMLKDYYPEEYEKVKEYVKKGRWKIAGSSLEESDSILPSPESLIRNILYGNLYFQQEFSTESYDYFLPDCFGFPASLPTVLNHCGLLGFSTQKLIMKSAVGIPFSIGIWKGPDQSRLPVALKPGPYVAKLFISPDKNIFWRRRLNKNGRLYNVWKEFRYYGTGDIGGAPSESSVKKAERAVKRKNSIICQDSSDRLFRDLSEDELVRLPEYSGDLLLTEHSAGSLTSQAIMKRWNRKNELLADAAERAAVAAWLIWGMKYPKETLAKAWERVIGCQMHDILTGTCIPDAYTFSNNDEVIALNTFSSILLRAVEVIAQQLDTDVEGIPLIVYNPLSFRREDLVEAVISCAEEKGAEEGFVAYGPEGSRLPVQIVSRDAKKTHIIFSADVPSVSWNVYTVKKEKYQAIDPPAASVQETAEGFVLQNPKYLVRVNRAGFVDSIFDKTQHLEILSGAIHYELQREKPLCFPAWNMDWRDRKKKAIPLIGDLVKIQITEWGPVRVAVEITRNYHGSIFVQKISLAIGGSSDRVEFLEKIHWRLSGYSLKVAFPLQSKNPHASYNWQVGKTKRNNNHKKKFEVPSHMWFGLTDISGKSGVSILEDSKYGSDKPNDNTLRLTLLYTPARHWFSVAFFDQICQDWGEHTVRYALYSHAGDWVDANSDQQALRFNQPLYPFETTPSSGPLHKSYSLLDLSSNNAIASAIKMSERENDALIIRLIESSGRKNEKFNVSFRDRICSASQVNGQEKEIGNVQFIDNTLEVDLSPYQIKAFSVKPSVGESRRNIDSVKPLAIPHNVKLFTENGEHAELDFSFPKELMPATIDSGDIHFLLKTDGNDTLACDGQELQLSPGSHDRLSLLMCAKREMETVFAFKGQNDKPIHLTIPQISGFIGQYDTREWKRKVRHSQRDYLWRVRCVGITPGFIKRNELAFYTTHMHSRGKDLPYQYGYMFRIDLEIPAGAERLVLSDNKEVFIFAASLSKTASRVNNCRFLTDKYDF